MIPIKRYSELKKLKTFRERYDYLRLKGIVGLDTFGYDRYLNQMLYASKKWLNIRDKVIIRDLGCDLAIEGYEIHGRIIVHHMNPITIEDLELEKDISINPEFLICVSLNTHNAIHFGNKSNLFDLPKDRKKGDTSLWKKAF